MSNWKFQKGSNNQITDVPGIKVGHTTLVGAPHINTGVTAILPCQDNIFQLKLPASTHIINGFGKSTGLIQIQELGTLETPIILTNTLSVGTAHSALVKYMLHKNYDIGHTTGTVNPIIMECNDGEINDIRGLFVEEKHVLSALANAKTKFEEGDVGAGKGMICYDLKGGIGSSSRIIPMYETDYTLGVLTLTNFGSIEDLTVRGRNIGSEIATELKTNSEDIGSIIVIIATDLPLDSRQLNRVAKRAQNAIARTGAYTGNGSGEIVLAFSTANRTPHYATQGLQKTMLLHEDKLNPIFKATTEAVEESILKSLFKSKSSVKRNGEKVYSITNWIDKY